MLDHPALFIPQRRAGGNGGGNRLAACHTAPVIGQPVLVEGDEGCLGVEQLRGGEALGVATGAGRGAVGRDGDGYEPVRVV